MALKCLNPFVQVFYSNGGIRLLNWLTGENCLNPFVQVFYSNEIRQEREIPLIVGVLIPLFRSFILMSGLSIGNSTGFLYVLIPLFRSFILIIDPMKKTVDSVCKVLIPLFRSFILISRMVGSSYRKIEGLNPFVQVFYSNGSLLPA